MKSMLLSLLVAAGVSGCASVVPSTAFLAARLDPLTADPADIAAFPDLPDGVNIRPGGGSLVLSGVRQDDQRVATEAFVLQEWNDGYRINPLDHARFRAQQALLTKWKAETEVAGSLSLTVDPCITGDGPDPDARYSVDVVLRQDGPRRPLLRDAPLSALSKAGLDAATFDRCEGD